MRAFLILTNYILLIAFCPCCAISAQEAGKKQTEEGNTVTKDYQLLMQIRGHEITAICVMNVTSDNSIIGTVVNEFGVKSFDFTYSDGKAKVLNVIGPLDKWYIRKVLRGDISFFLSNYDQGKNAMKKKRKLTVMPNGDIIVSNERYNINYTFSPMQGEL